MFVNMGLVFFFSNENVNKSNNTTGNPIYLRLDKHKRPKQTYNKKN